jgi:hypothetical protein
MVTGIDANNHLNGGAQRLTAVRITEQKTVKRRVCWKRVLTTELEEGSMKAHEVRRRHHA